MLVFSSTFPRTPASLSVSLNRYPDYQKITYNGEIYNE